MVFPWDKGEKVSWVFSPKWERKKGQEPPFAQSARGADAALPGICTQGALEK